ncbi:MdtA/MuxA family multidrug efflux RND transporter periplasmic adaptor subunit [Rhizosaccharibacter radicis]|uniref:MdtA/MuxA family multidrug efflux RND transporter periplasmic adaptor subunit n=1 Tax=Rhizosaccharibacter radicis TaxID=2782605 RepID=A0ABT1VXG3_9PROT|nr:MdtA/MuxA family multidrug efflux RND transporter periplasmic adaptor subunit [Acetobacteraceae bacterium KSS12]
MEEPTEREPRAPEHVRVDSQTPPSSAATPRRRRRWLPWLILLIAISAVAFALLRPRSQTGNPGGGHRHGGGSAGQEAAGPQPVTVAKAHLGDMPVVLTQLGTVTPLATITVQSQLSGYLLEVNFTEGQTVHKGDQLALVDPRLYQAQLVQYEGALVRDQAQLREAKADLARYQLLLSQKSIASQTAQNQIFVVGQYEGAVKADQGQIDYAKQQIDYCHIRSPVDGRVGLRQVDAGNYITSSATNGLVVVTQLHPISVIFTIPQDQIPAVQDQLRAGATLQVEAYDRTNTVKLATGKVFTLDNTIDTATGTVRIRSMFPNEDDRLFPNQFVNARLLLRTVHDAVLVPTGAIQAGSQGNFVYVVKPDDTVDVRDVTTGVSADGQVLVSKGLAAGETVVTDGTDRLHAGSKVRVPATSPSAPAANDDQAAGAHRRHRRSQ